MIVIKGRNGKSKWLAENFIDDNTLVFEGQHDFPNVIAGVFVSSNTTYEVLKHFVEEYFEDTVLQKEFNKIVLYRTSDVHFALGIENEIKKYFPKFEVAIAIDTFDEELIIEEEV